MLLKFFKKFIIFGVLINSLHCSKVPLVQIENDEFKGSMVGLEKLNILNETFNAFLGIPYAKPPLGDLRFRDPRRLDNFEGTFYAIHEGYECCSITASNASEDCLNLNVYTKQLNPSQPLPVLVVIHPGGLYLGSSKMLDPCYIMTKDIVLVTFNYRLGSLGFLNLGSPEIPGNAGLKDQVYALRWVTRNIAKFGGNPEDITLMGYSAGALAVALHLVSPMSKGLFQKAILMSGSVPPQTKLPQGDQKYLGVRQAKRLNCPQLRGIQEVQWNNGDIAPDYKDVQDSEVIECLKQFKGVDIANTLRKMFDFGKDNPIYLWLPVVEKAFGQESFLNEDFYMTLKRMDKVEVPLLIGYTNGEFCTSSRDILKDESLKSKFASELNRLAPRTFMYEMQRNAQDISDKLSDFYFNGSKTFSSQDYDLLCDLFSDSLIRFGAHHTAELIVAQKGLVYFYEFRYLGRSKKVKDELFPFKKARVEHMDDWQYLFNWSNREDLSEEESKLRGLYTDFIYDFIKNGKLSNAMAKPYPESYAVIDEAGIRFEKGRSFENYKFWLDLLKD